MKHALLVFAIAVCLGLFYGGLGRAYDQVTNAVLSADAKVAIDVSCGNQTGRTAKDCRSRLERLYLAGALDPDKTLRTWCDSIKNARWGGSPPPAPRLCVERYGGWIGR